MTKCGKELVWLAPIEYAEECLAILEKCMISGSEYWMRTVPMKAEGILGHTWRKDKYLCDLCSKEYKPNIEVLTVKHIKDKYQIVCKECWASLEID